MAFDLTVDDEAALFNELRAQDARLATYRAQAVVQPQLAAALTTVHTAAPGALPGVKLAIAQAVAAGIVTHEQAVQAAVLAGTHQPSWAERIKKDLQPWTAAKGLVRTGLGVLESGYQALGSSITAQNPSRIAESRLAQGHQGSQAFGVTGDTGLPTPGLPSLNDFALSTTLGQDVRQLATQGTLEQGSGFFPGGAQETARQASERNIRGTIPGTGQVDTAAMDAAYAQTGVYPTTPIIRPGTEQTRTFGRILASQIVEPGSTGYRVISGLADAGMAWYGDPANIALQGLHSVRQTRNTLTAAKALTDADLARVLRPGEKLITNTAGEQGVMRTVGTKTLKNGATRPDKAFVPYAELATEARTARAAEAGAISSFRNTFSPRQSEAWLQGSDGQKLVNFLAQDRQWMSIHNALGRNVAPEIITRLQDAKTPDAIREVLYDVLGRSIRSTTDIKSPTGVGAEIRNVLARSRLAQKMPEPKITGGYKMTEAQKINEINNVDAFIANAGRKITFERRSKLVEDYARGMETNSQDRYGAIRNVMKTIENTMVEGHGVDRALAHDITTLRDMDAVRLYSVDQLGSSTPFTFMRHTAKGFAVDDAVTGAWRMDGPQLLSEGLSRSVDLPDPRQIRRLTSHFGWMTSTKEGKLRMPLAALEHTQAVLLKIPAIMRPAFLVRVEGEEQLRMAAQGLSSTFSHPADFIRYAMHNSGAYDALGQDFVALSKQLGDVNTWDELSASLHRGLPGARGAKNYVDPLSAETKSFFTGSWDPVDKATHARQWEMGIGDELRQLYRDPTASRIAQGQSNDDIMRWFRSTDEGRAALAELGSRTATNTVTGEHVRMARDLESNATLNEYIAEVRQRVDTKVGQNADLLGVIAHGHVGAAEATVPNTALTVLEAGPRREADAFGPASTWVGSRVRLADGRLGVVVNDAGVAGHSIVQVGAAAWDGRGRMSEQLRSAARAWRESDASPQKVKYAIRANERVVGYRGEAADRAKAMKDTLVNGFFSGLYGRSSDYLSRSPAFRQFYWQRATELADNLAPAEANRFLKTMGEAADRHEGGVVANLLGGGDRAVTRAIENARTADGVVTLEQLDSYAKGWALDRVNKLLYDASRRSQFFDVARVIFPFGEAWKEVLGSWAKIMAENPRIARRAQVVIEGARGADPDGNGQGWFHTDPTTGKEVYTYPFSSQLSRILTGSNPLTRAASHVPGVNRFITDHPVGIEQPLQGSVQGLNIGMSPTPSLGWIGQIGVAQLVHDRPQLDFVKSFLLPYGETKLGAEMIVPSWLQKVAGGLADSPNTTRIYGDTYMRVVQTLSASGKYGTTDDELRRMQRDATSEARVATIIRGVAQATGPSSPSVDFKVVTTKGDMMAGALIQEYVRLRNENPDGALEDFLKLYGKDAMAYAVSRTRSVNGGLDASKEFGNWERDHGSLFDSFPDIAGYFADVGTDFDFAVYDRQLASGKREKLSGPEYLSLVNETIVNRRYYGARDDLLAQNQAAGRQSLTTAQRDWLSQLKEKLVAQYPISHPSVHAASQDEMRHLSEAVTDKRLADNPIAQATGKYLSLRAAALAEADRRKIALSNPKAADLRDWLAQAGAKLSERTPTFSRLWDRLLAQEVT